MAYPPAVRRRQPELRHIEVEGRVKAAHAIAVSRNEMLHALDQAEEFLLAIVQPREDGTTEPPVYLRNRFDTEPGWGVAAVSFETEAPIERAQRQP